MPDKPSVQLILANRSSPDDANKLDRSVWSAAKICTAKLLAAIKSSKQFADLPMLHRMSGGVKETELKLLTVMPTFWPSLPSAVIIVTPVAKLPSALRNSVWLKGCVTR